MRLLILIGAFVLLAMGQSAYANGHAFGSLVLLGLGAFVLYLHGYSLGFDVGEQTARPVPDQPNDKPKQETR